MSSSDLIRWGGLAAMGAGVLFILYSLLSLAAGKGDEPGPLDILAILAYSFEVVGLIGFHTLQGSNYGRIGRAGLHTTIGAIVVWEFLILTSLFGGNEGLPEWLVAVGVLGTLVGEVLYGAATLQVKCCRAGAVYCSSYFGPVQYFFLLPLRGTTQVYGRV